MVNIKGYLSSNFTKAFLTIFLPFFMIVSLVYLVKIAQLTSKIQIDFLELLTLYAYSLPDIIFYTLPLSFVTALTNVLLRLSQDNELIALYALGLKAKKILHSLVLLSLLFSILLLSISFLAMPLSKQYKKSFILHKQADAKLNIVAGQLGQKFGDFYIYVKGKKEDLFQNLVIYNRTNRANEQFFSSKTGKLKHEKSVTSLVLNDGYGYTYAETDLQQAKYKTLEVFDQNKQRNFNYKTLKAYWAQVKEDIGLRHKMFFYIFVSLIPLLSIYLIAAFSMINPRYQKNRSFMIIFGITFLLYGIASSLQKWGTVSALIFATIIITVLGQWVFQKRVSKYF